MGSGSSNVVINPRERVVSTDINRLQRFQDRALAQVLMRLHGSMQIMNALVGPGVTRDPVAPSVTTYPVPHKVLGGLTVRPDAPAYLTVDAGSAAFLAPTFSSNADDSDWVVVDDPGVTSTTAIQFLANASGIRLDVVECSPADTVLSIESRDQFDPATGAFTPALLQKTKTGRLQYRIRRGVAGAGIPANDPDWCPLAVVVVTSTATGFTTCDVYDVRPLVAPAVLSPETAVIDNNPSLDSQAGEAMAIDGRSSCAALYSASATCSATGWFSAGYRGYRVGGPLYKSTPDASWVASDTEFVALEEATNWSADQPPVLSGNYRNCLACVLPTHFHRFAKYSRVSVVGSHSAIAGRFPCGPNGIYCLTAMCANKDGGLYSGILPPASTGVTQQCFGPVVAEVLTSGTNHLLGFVVANRRVELGQTGYGSAETSGMAIQSASITYPDSNRVTMRWTMTPHQANAFSSGAVPMDATAVLVAIDADIGYTSPSPGWALPNFRVGTNSDPDSDKRNIVYPTGWDSRWNGTSGPTGTDNHAIYYLRVPILRGLAVSTQYLYCHLAIFGATVNTSGTTGTMRVIGYER